MRLFFPNKHMRLFFLTPLLIGSKYDRLFLLTNRQVVLMGLIVRVKMIASRDTFSKLQKHRVERIDNHYNYVLWDWITVLWVGKKGAK